MKVTTVANNTQSQSGEEPAKKGKAEKKAGKRIGYNYIIVKSLKESKKNDVVKCLYIKSLVNWGFCVIKEGTYGDSKDHHGRDIVDRLVWQKQLHELLQDKVRMPKILGQFEENGNYYLVMEYLKGDPFYKVWKKHIKVLRESILSGKELGFRFLDYILQIVHILENFHQHHIVHRDATSNNFLILREKKVAVIDMELSYSLKQDPPQPPFLLGTHGYMSIQQEAIMTPTVEEDIFAVGSILLMTFTGISPGKLNHTLPEELENKIYFLVPDQQMADIIIGCLHTDVEKRPSLSKVKTTITEYKAGLSKKVSRPVSKPVLVGKANILATIQEAVYTLTTPLLADVDKGWFAEDKRTPSNPDKNQLNKTWIASFSLGGAGIIYFLSQAKKLGLDIVPALPMVQKSLDLIRIKYIDSDISNSAGLFFGSSGIAASLASAVSNNLIEESPQYIEWINTLLYRDNKSLGMMQGIAGQGTAHFLCSSFVKSEQQKDSLYHFAQQLIEKQEEDGSWVHSIKQGKKRIIPGFAHGVAGIVYFLLEFASRFKDPLASASAQKGLAWLMKKSKHKEGIIDWRSSSGKRIFPGWCDGAVGIAFTFLRAYLLTGEQSYKKYVIGALRNHPFHVLLNNLSQCHGLSGLGEVYMECYRVFQEEEWLERSEWIAQVLMKLKKQHVQYGPYWIVESERQPVPGLMTGNSGILHFLLHNLYPDKMNFPLMPGEKGDIQFPEKHSNLLRMTNSKIYELSSNG